ncbi:MAG: T9SS type A sorting domain-containing protein [Bacteroidales bacterium]|nr:T9SS type A sorting domain-containing protein [Bacteroidales bacterium]
MKKNILFLLILCMSVMAQATDLTGLKIYINPGHGGHEGNDRSVWTIPVPEVWTNPNGYWESNSNLVKGLALRDMLEDAGATVIMSRVENRTEDDRPLSSIAEEANANQVDHFLSIHSNALNTLTNYLLILYRGRQGAPTTPPSDQMAASFGNIQIKNPLTVWTSPNPLLRGDITFYPADWNGLGVLRPLVVPGFLSEGSFHDYPPETHRLCNNDYCKLEALRLFEHFYTWYKRETPTTGTLSGWVKSENELVDVLNEPKFTYIEGTDDQWLPLNGATVKLLRASDNSVLQTYTTDDWYNGIFAFYDLEPGNYKVSIEKENYKSKVVDATVEAGKIAGLKVQLKNIRLDLPDYPEPEQEQGMAALDSYEFEPVGTTLQPDWMKGAVIQRAIKRDNKIYVLTESPKLFIVNASTLALEKEMKLTGINGINDIAISADHYLMAITKADNGCKVYTWEADDAEPTLLFETDKHAAFANATVGSTMAVTGSRWNCTVYTTVINKDADGNAPAVALMGMKYHADSPTEISTKYMLVGDALTAEAWGKNPVLTVMPNGHLYVDSETILPAEFIFDWDKADGTKMEKKSFMTEDFTPDVSSCGGTFFRYANHTYLAMPAAEAGGVKVGVVLFDVNEGLDQAKKISERYPNTGLGTTSATYMTSFGVVDGYNIDLLLLVQNQGFARYRTIGKPVMNIYASELSLSSEKTFGFKLNEDATSVLINIYKDGELLESYPVGAKTKGAHSIANPFGEKDFDEWGITASARAVAYPLKVSDDSQLFQYYAPRGLAVDNTPESPFFGRIYVTESLGGTVSAGAPSDPRTVEQGVYMLDAALTDVANQGDKSYSGNVNWGTGGNNYQWPLTRPSVAPDGKVYLSSSTLDGSGIYIMDPANPTADFKPVFSGERNAGLGTEMINGKLIHSPIMHCNIQGTGADTKLYTYDRNFDPGVHVNINQYDIGDGSTLPWKSEPTAVVYNDKEAPVMLNGNGCIASDGRGGWWLSQYRYTSSTAVPSLIHITDGKINYNCGSEIVSSFQGGMGVNKDGSMLAIGRETGKVAVYDVVYDAANVPTLTEKFVIDWGDGKGNTMGVEFDVAGNLYIVSNSNERLMVYSLPNLNNTYTTRIPANNNGTGLKTISVDENVKVYPNPASTEVIIDAQEVFVENYSLYDIAGGLMTTGEMNGVSSTISVTNLQEGIYILQLNTTQGVVNKRIIIKR